jgi:hypothetical protein
METLDQGATRNVRGRFMPGRSGNPAGKKPGTLNYATILKNSLSEGDAEAAALQNIDKAVAGNLTAGKFLFDRVDPKPRGRPVALVLPDDATASDLLAASEASIRAMMTGEISPDEALLIARCLRERANLIRDLAPVARKPVVQAPAAQEPVALEPVAPEPERAAAMARAMAAVSSLASAADGGADLHFPCILQGGDAGGRDPERPPTDRLRATATPPRPRSQGVAEARGHA